MHKILLVEDDEIIRQQVKQLLEQWGYEVVAVEDFMDVLPNDRFMRVGKSDIVSKGAIILCSKNDWQARVL